MILPPTTQFFKAYTSILRDPNLRIPFQAKWILLYLMDREKCKRFPVAYSIIAKDIGGCSTRTARRMVEILIDHGLVTIVAQKQYGLIYHVRYEGGQSDRPENDDQPESAQSDHPESAPSEKNIEESNLSGHTGQHLRLSSLKERMVRDSSIPTEDEMNEETEWLTAKRGQEVCEAREAQNKAAGENRSNDSLFQGSWFDWKHTDELRFLKSRLAVEDVALKLGLPWVVESRRKYIRCPSGKHRDDNFSCDLNSHDERHKHRVKCFACDFSEDVIGLVRIVKKLGFNDACTWIAGQFGFDKPKSRSKQKEVPPDVVADAIKYWRDHGIECKGRSLVKDKVYFSPGRKAWVFDHRASEIDPGGTGRSYRLLYPKPGGKKVLQDRGAKNDVFKLGDDRTVCLTEGFPDCVSVHLNTGKSCWTMTCGAGARLPYHRRDDFRSREKIIVIYDHDKAGNSGHKQIVKELRAVTIAKIYVVHLPPGVKDISEWFAAGHTKAEFEALIGEAVLQTRKGNSKRRYAETTVLGEMYENTIH
jgi:Toprim-like